MSRTVRFPEDRSLGKLLTRDHSDAGWLGWVTQGASRGQAIGEVLLPDNKDLALIVDREAISDLSPLLSLDADDLQALIFPLFSINPDIAFYIQRLRGLRLLRLELIILTNNEISYLKELTDLRWLYLFNESTDNNSLAALRDEMPDCIVSVAKDQNELPHDGLVRSDAQYSVHEMMELMNEKGFRDSNGRPFTDIETFLLALERDATREAGE